MNRILTRLLAHRARNADEGVAMITVMLFLGVATALTLAVSAVSVNNLQNASRDAQAGGALQTSEGGVAQAIELMRTEPLGFFSNCTETSCSPSPAPSSGSDPKHWVDKASPMLVSSNGTIGTCSAQLACFGVWISTVTPYKPGSSALLRIHSTGQYGAGPAARTLDVDVNVKPDTFPIGVFANSVNTGGTFGVNHESLFSTSCIDHRQADSYTTSYPGYPGVPVPNSTGGGGGISFSGIDAEYQIPAAAHSLQYVRQQNNGCDGGTTNSKQQANVHDSSQANFAPCNTALPDYYDQDSQGGTLSSSCPGYKAFTNTATGQAWPTTSAFTMSDLTQYGYQAGGLSQGDYAALKSMAQSSGTYFTSASTSPNAALTASGATNAVVYYDLPSGSGQTVKISPSDIPSMYFRNYNDNTSTCTLASLVIVVRNGDLKYDTSGGAGSGGDLVASFFVPEGSYTGQGNASIIGTLFAKTLASGSGTQNWYLDNCFVANPPGPIMNVRAVNYREVDTQDVS